jgi:hypothetical protein
MLFFERHKYKQNLGIMGKESMNVIIKNSERYINYFF